MTCVLLLAALPVAWTYPLALHFPSHILGNGFGDNVTFLWNFWWMRVALASPALDFFRTPYLFAPTGVDLTLHTHTALPALVGATVLQRLDVIAALNATILAAIYLSGAGAYCLAWRGTRSHVGALMAGIIYAGSPYMVSHLQGHFNLIHAWTIPVFAYCVLEALERHSIAWSIAGGVVLGATVYVDYYLLVYSVILLGCLVITETTHWSISRGDGTVTETWLFRVSVATVCVMLSLIAAIVLTDGFRVTVAGLAVSASNLFNPLQLLWAALVVALLAWWRPRIGVRPMTANGHSRILVIVATLAVAALLVGSPLVVRGWDLLTSGEYVSQRYFWRSAPKGVDVSTLLIGTRYSGLLGRWLEPLHDRAALDGIDDSAWLGVVPLGLSVMAVCAHYREPHVRRWTVIGVMFFIWSLGPHLMVAGMNTGMVLPQVLTRYIPIVSNARIPGRAIVLTYLALAMLSAYSVARWRVSGRDKHPYVMAALAGLLIADYIPRPFVVTRLDRPGIYPVLRDRPESGVIMELPLGVRDGFGERGLLDHRILFYQTIHERPQVGGFVARLPPGVSRFYLEDPLLSGLLRLSGDRSLPDTPLPAAEAGLERLRNHGVRFVVLNRDVASPELGDYVERVLPLRLLTKDDGSRRSVFVVP